MEASLSLQSAQDLIHLEQQARGYYHSRWTSLEQAARLEYSRASCSQLEEVGRFEAKIVNRFSGNFSQSEQLAFNRGHTHGAAPSACTTHGSPDRAGPNNKTASGAILIP
eukprot:909832-Amphidinium_carterae.4